MTQKKLQKDSVYSEYDEDGDGVVSDEELSHVKEIKKTETELRKNLAQLRMARYTLVFMGCYAIFLASPWCSAEKLEGLGAVTDLIFLSGAGIVGAYMGTTAWMNKKQEWLTMITGRGKRQLKKVVKGLSKASKTHAKQAKTLKKIMNTKKRSRRRG